MDKIFSDMLEIGIYSGVIVLIVLILRLVFHKASKAVICALWLLVGLRLLLFVPIESAFAIMPRLSIKDMVREQSESTEILHLQRDDEVDISDSKEKISDIENNLSVFQNNIGLYRDNGLKDGYDIPAQNNSENQDSVETIAGPKDGTVYKYENPDRSGNIDNEEFITSTQEISSTQAISERKSNVFSILAYAWIGGTIAMLLYGIVKAVKVKRQLADAVRLEGYEDVYLTNYVRNAFVFGLIRPRIYMNYSVTDEQRKYVLIHEREHIARKDYIFKVLAFVLLSLYWFVPWVWVAFIMYSRDMELACDEGVIRNMDPASRAKYAETLFGCSVSESGRAYSAVSFGELGVNERVKNIMKYKKKTIWISVAAGVVAILCLVFFLTPKTTNAENDISEKDRNEAKWDGESAHTDNDTTNSKQKKGNGLELYKEYFDESTGKLTLPEGIERIEDHAFVGCTQLKAIELPSTVKGIGNAAFERCTNLLQIDMPDGLAEIGDYAFKDCNLLTYVLLPSTLEKIGTRAFMNCKSLLKVTLSEKIIDSGAAIEDNAFLGCYSLLDEYKEQIIKVNPKAYQVDAIDAASDLTNIEYSRKESAPDKFQMKLDDPYDSFYVVIYAMEDGYIICEDYHCFPYEEKVDYLGEKKRYKLSDDCKIIVQAKDEGNKGKICYIDKDELAYIARMYGFVRPDGSHEGYVKSEYVYPFLCVMDQNHEVRCLRECYDIFEVSQNLLDKVKNVNYTSEQIEALDKKLKQDGITAYDICNMQELKVNQAGQTYGSRNLGADLIPAKGIDGVIGYISNEMLSSTPHTIDEVLEQTENAEKGQIIPLYDCEGKVIGGFCVGTVSDEEIEEYRNELNKIKNTVKTEEMDNKYEVAADMVPIDTELDGAHNGKFVVTIDGKKYRYRGAGISDDGLTADEMIYKWEIKGNLYEFYTVKEYPDCKYLKCLYNKNGFMIEYAPALGMPEGFWDEIINDGFVVMKNGSAISGEEKWLEFVKKTESKEPAEIRIAQYFTLHGNMAKNLYELSKMDYPFAGFYLLKYDGENFIYTSLQKTDGEYVIMSDDENYREETYKYLKHYTEEAIIASELYNTFDKYVLVDDDTLTWNDIWMSSISSDSSAGLRYAEVFNKYDYKDGVDPDELITVDIDIQ